MGCREAENTRALGPFVNADHFADYICVILPLALAATIFPQSFGSAESFAQGSNNKRGYRAILAAAILLSFSRTIWVAAPIATTLFFLMIRQPVRESSSAAAGRSDS